MSRLANLNPAAIRALFATEAQDSIVSLLSVAYNTYSSLSINPVQSYIYISDNFTHKFKYVDANTYLAYDVRTGSAGVSYTHTSSTTFAKEIFAEMPDEVFYGTISQDKIFLFIPFNITLPVDQAGTVPVCKITFNDITQILSPIIREITDNPSVSVQLVLYSDTNNIISELPNFLMSNITYNMNTVQVDLTLESFVTEPFPAHTFTPSIFPGIF
jgi:hypothetical protein